MIYSDKRKSLNKETTIMCSKKKIPYVSPSVEIVKLEISDIIATSSYRPRKIAVLGMQESGKTQFLKTLKNEEYSSYLQSSQTEYEEFDVSLSSGKVIKIASGIDVGGSDHYVDQYKEIAKNSDTVIFVFNLYKFMNDADYRLKSRSRLEFFHNGLTPCYGEKIIIGSFADKFTTDVEKAKAMDFVYEHLRDVYPTIAANNFFMADMRDSQQIFDLANKIFS